MEGINVISVTPEGNTVGCSDGFAVVLTVGVIVISAVCVSVGWSEGLFVGVRLDAAVGE